MSNAFANLINQFDQPAAVNNQKVEKKKNKEVQAEYIQLTEKYRVKINQQNNAVEKLKLALELIAKITGDELFYKQNVKQIQEGENILDQYFLSQYNTVFWTEVCRRATIHENCYKKEKTVLNEYLYEKAKNDLELAHYRCMQVEQPSAEHEEKIQELEKDQRELDKVYIRVIESEKRRNEEGSGQNLQAI